VYRILFTVFLVGFLLGMSSVAAKTASPASPADLEQAKASAWADLGNWDRAVKHYRVAVSLDPKNPAIRMRLAEGLSRLGQLEEALAEMERLRRDPKASADVHCQTGVFRLAQNKPVEACACFESALKATKQHARSLFGQGQCQDRLFVLLKKNSHKRLAMAAYRNYLKQYPEGRHRLSAQEALQKLEYGRVGQWMSDAKTAMAEGKFRLAAETLARIIKEKPDLQEAHHLRGLALASPVIGQIEQAAEAWEKAPDIKDARLALGIFKFEDDELEEAVEHLMAAIRIDPEFAEPYYHLGLVYMELQNARKPPKGMTREDLMTKTHQAFKKVCTLAPRSALSRRAKSKLQLLTGKVFALNEGEVIDAASEMALGNKLTEHMEKRFGLVQDAKLVIRLNKILQRISQHSERLPGTMPYKVRVLDVDGINALSFTGGTIFIYKGLIDFVRRELADSDDALAFVIGHEVVHVDRRHGLGMLDLVGGAQQLMEGRSLNVRSLNTLMKGMTRKHEFEADKIGALFALRAGFDPSAAYRFHQRMLATGHEVPEGMDHPTHAERGEQMKEYLLGLRSKARHFDMGLDALSKHQNKDAVRHLEVFLGLFPHNVQARNNLGVAKYRWAMTRFAPEHAYKISTDVDPRTRIPKIRVRSVAGKKFVPEIAYMVEAVGLFEFLTRLNPAYQRGQVNLGAAHLALGQVSLAREAFEAALKLKDSPEVKNNLAVACLVDGDEAKGERLLAEVLKRHPAFADAHFNMARLMQGRNKGNVARNHYLAYLKLDEKSGWADAARQGLKELR